MMTAQQVHKFRGLFRCGSMTFGEICDRTQIDMMALFALRHYLAGKTASKAARYWNRNLSKMSSSRGIQDHFRLRAVSA